MYPSTLYAEQIMQLTIFLAQAGLKCIFFIGFLGFPGNGHLFRSLGVLKKPWTDPLKTGRLKSTCVTANRFSSVHTDQLVRQRSMDLAANNKLGSDQ